MKYPFCLTVNGSRIRYEADGPDGKFAFEGPREEWREIRNNARVAAGYEPVQRRDDVEPAAGERA